MIILPATNTILRQTVFKRLSQNKKEACEFTFSDFDSVSFRVSTPLEDKESLFIEMNVPFWEDIKDVGAQEGLEKFYGDFLESVENQTVRLKVAIDDFKDEEKSEEFSELVSNMKNNIICEVLKIRFRTVKAQAPPKAIAKIALREDTTIFVQSLNDRIFVHFALTFEGKTDKIIGNLFMSEFVETKRKLGAAPLCAFSSSPPLKLKSEIDENKYKDRTFLTLSFILKIKRFFQNMSKQRKRLHRLQNQCSGLGSS
ncbi:Arp complex subunit, variant 2 [Bonamia ostreae]|uniref:Arp2/3 complex 34 kDa subunit n=1 Tax=Bonamia ostreae TaxID=126728 RepID=A0ABV2AQ55_9EUKA